MDFYNTAVDFIQANSELLFGGAGVAIAGAILKLSLKLGRGGKPSSGEGAAQNQRGGIASTNIQIGSVSFTGKDRDDR